MKIKLKDLTIGQFHAICQIACEDCPLHCGHDYKIGCMVDHMNFDDTEVDIPDELLEEAKNES